MFESENEVKDIFDEAKQTERMELGSYYQGLFRQELGPYLHNFTDAIKIKMHQYFFLF